jgi:predicted RNA-binding Zn ribbon-like protein
MEKKEHDRGDWRGNHLFVGNRLALDFLNTELVANGETTELLANAASVARWMAHAQLLTEPAATKLEQAWKQIPRAEKAAAGLRRFRDRLRVAIVAFEAGAGVPANFLDELNSLLRTRPVYRAVEADGHGGYTQVLSFTPQLPDDLLGPLAQDTVMLLTGAAADRVRKCEGCPVHFLDVSKKGSRRWCSMDLCGNKVKVAAYQRRKREEQPGSDPGQPQPIDSGDTDQRKGPSPTGRL